LRAAGAVILGKTNLSEWAQLPLDAFDLRVGAGPRRADEKSLCAGSQPVRLKQRVSGTATSGESVRGGYRQQKTDGSIVCPSSTNGLVGHQNRRSDL